MLTLLGRKRITEDKAANVFVNSIIDVVEKGFADVAGIVNTDPAFVKHPGLREDDSDKFLLIVVAGNLKYIHEFFDAEQGARMKEIILEKMSKAFGVTESELRNTISEYHECMARVNHPSKNTLYAMSKAFFHKYDLAKYQEDYFKSLNAPNPLLLKRLDEIMTNFIWDWPGFLDKYKVAS
jgi:hypothetical protein